MRIQHKYNVRIEQSEMITQILVTLFTHTNQTKRLSIETLKLQKKVRISSLGSHAAGVWSYYAFADVTLCDLLASTKFYLVEAYLPWRHLSNVT